MKFVSETFSIHIGETANVGEPPRHLLTIPALVERLQEIAWAHSVTRQVDVPRLLERGVSWVLSRMRIEVDLLPTQYQMVTLKTWIANIDRYFYYREFQLTDAETGENLVRATSIWGILDMEKRRIVAIPDFIRDRTMTYHADFDSLVPASGKLPSLTNPEFSEAFTARWHDLDANKHVNNTRYFQWLIEALPPVFLDAHPLRQLDIIFRAEAMLGQQVLSEAQSESETSFIHRITNLDGQPMVQARTVWY